MGAADDTGKAAGNAGSFDAAKLEKLVVAGTDPDVIGFYRSLPARAAAGTGRLIDDELVVMDTETTGLNETRDSLIEISACILRGNEVLDRFDTFVDPGRRIPPEIVELTGITQEDVAGAPDPGIAVEQFAEFAAGRPLVAHNAAFDRKFIMCQAEKGAVSDSWLDSLALSNIVLPRLKSHRLEDLSRAFGLHSSTHRACDDVEALAALWPLLVAALEGMDDMVPGFATLVAQVSPEKNWPLRTVFQQVAARGDGKKPSLEKLRRKRVKPFAARVERKRASKKGAAGAHEGGIGGGDGDGPAQESGKPLVFPDGEKIDAAFTREGTVGAMYPGFEPREAQVQMAHEVLDAFRTRGCRVLEAGTGVGKSMAYLMPAATVAKANGIRIGVATKTNALMDQLMYHELPDLARAMGGLDYVSLKGYDHYLCMRKLQNFSGGSGLEPADVEFAAALLGFVAQTTWGDLGALRINWHRMPREEVVASSNECLKHHCPFYPNLCYLHGARKHAEDADIVVTNHALLFRDMSLDHGILPQIRHWVVDEAHTAENEARRQLSKEISAPALEQAAESLLAPKSGLVARLRHKAHTLSGANTLHAQLNKVEECAEHVRSDGKALFTSVKDLREATGRESSYDTTEIWIGPALQHGRVWKTVDAMGRSLEKNLDMLAKSLRDLVTGMERFEGKLASQCSEAGNMACRLFDMREALLVVLDGGKKVCVRSAYVHRDPQKHVEALRVQCLDVGMVLARDLYPNVDSIVFTSATLSTGDEGNPFGPFVHAMGLSRIGQERLGCRMLESSYDFEHNMRIVLPQGMPGPYDKRRRAQLVELLYEVHVAMQGSTLTLFTSRREMEDFASELKPRLKDAGLELLVQPTGAGKHAVQERFVEEEKASLFALKSFWEGFDAPGPTLRCVVVAKLPFGNPNDPLACEREHREGDRAWSLYSLPQSIVEMKQAAGRLIRRSDDAGFLVLADGRLQTKGYGKRFLQAMPSGNVAVEPLDEIVAEMRAAR